MLPAADLSEILANLSALNLQPNTTAQILAAVLAPLLRISRANASHRRGGGRSEPLGEEGSPGAAGRLLERLASPRTAHANVLHARSRPIPAQR